MNMKLFFMVVMMQSWLLIAMKQNPSFIVQVNLSIDSDEMNFLREIYSSNKLLKLILQSYNNVFIFRPVTWNENQQPSCPLRDCPGGPQHYGDLAQHLFMVQDRTHQWLYSKVSHSWYDSEVVVLRDNPAVNAYVVALWLTQGQDKPSTISQSLVDNVNTPALELSTGALPSRSSQYLSQMINPTAESPTEMTERQVSTTVPTQGLGKKMQSNDGHTQLTSTDFRLSQRPTKRQKTKREYAEFVEGESAEAAEGESAEFVESESDKFINILEDLIKQSENLNQFGNGVEGDPSEGHGEPLEPLTIQGEWFELSSENLT